MEISSQLARVCSALERAYDFQRVVIRHASGGFSCTTRTTLWELLPQWLFSCFSSWADEGYLQENRETIAYFHKVFGEKRMKKLSERHGLSLQVKRESGLTRGEIRTLFVGLAEVHLCDLEDLFDKIQHDKRELGEVEREAKEALGARFRSRVFSSLSKEDYDLLFFYLVPFSRIEDVFFNHLPNFGFWSNFASKQEMRGRAVYICERVRREGKSVEERVWEAWVAKTILLRRVQPTGVIIPHPRGYYAIHGELEGGGASMIFLKALQEDLPSLVKALGTRVTFNTPDSWLSVLNNFYQEIGILGVTTIQDSFRYLLGRNLRKSEKFEKQYRGSDPKTFCRSRLERIQGIGFSLGAAQLQLLSQRHPDLFSQLTLVGAPGISKKKGKAYGAIKYGPSLRYMIEIDDVVHRTGEVKLGFCCSSGVELVVFSSRKMTKEEVANLLLHPPSLPESLFLKGVAFFKAFLLAHARQTTLQKEHIHHVFQAANAKDLSVIRAVLQDDSWEGERKSIHETGHEVADHFEETKPLWWQRLRLTFTF